MVNSNIAPSGSLMPAMNYKNKERGTGNGERESDHE